MGARHIGTARNRSPQKHHGPPERTRVESQARPLFNSDRQLGAASCLLNTGRGHVATALLCMGQPCPCVASQVLGSQLQRALQPPHTLSIASNKLECFVLMAPWRVPWGSVQLHLKRTARERQSSHTPPHVRYIPTKLTNIHARFTCNALKHSIYTLGRPALTTSYQLPLRHSREVPLHSMPDATNQCYRRHHPRCIPNGWCFLCINRTTRNTILYTIDTVRLHHAGTRTKQKCPTAK